MAAKQTWPLFDRLASSYDEWYRSRLGRFVDAVEWKALLDLLRPKAGERILDIGSGTGRNAGRLANLGVQVVGLEPSAPMLAVAREGSVHEPPSYVRGVAEALPFSDGVFDAVLAVTTLEFVSDVEAALSEAARLTKAGGRIVVGVLNSEGPWAARRRRSGDALWTGAHFFSELRIKTLLQRFGPVKIRRAVYVPPSAARLPPLIFPLIEWLGPRLRSVPAFIVGRADSGGEHDLVPVFNLPLARGATRTGDRRGAGQAAGDWAQSNCGNHEHICRRR